MNPAATHTAAIVHAMARQRQEHWAVQYIGRPWVCGAQGPASFDCWGFVRYIQREHFGRALPEVTVDLPRDTAAQRLAWSRAVGEIMRAHPHRAAWRPLQPGEAAIEGDAVDMSHSKHPWHVGVWIDADRGGVLHCQEPLGVTFTAPHTLFAMGWGNIRCYRWVG